MPISDMLLEMKQTLAQAKEDYEEAAEAVEILKELRQPRAAQETQLRKLATQIEQYQKVIENRLKMHKIDTK